MTSEISVMSRSSREMASRFDALRATSGIGGEDATQRGRETVGVAALAVLAAKESAVVAREDHGLLSEPFGHNDGRAVGQCAGGFGPGSDDDAGRRGTQGPEVELIVGARDH